VTLDCKGVNQYGETVVEGVATVLAPTKKIRVARASLPHVEIQNHDRFQAIIQSCRGLKPIPTAIVHPIKPNALEAVVDCVNAGLITPILIGPLKKIKSAENEVGINLSAWEKIDTDSLFR